MKPICIIISLLLLAPLASGFGDLNQYAFSEHDSQASAPVLVEWFHGEGDEEYVSTLEEMDSSGEITLIHWRTGAEEEGSDWPDDDANSRAMFHEIEQFPAMTVDGFVVDMGENMSNFDDIVQQMRVNDNQISVDYSIELIGSNKVELISIIAEWENPQALKEVTQIHVFIIETKSTDSKGRTVQNLLRDWAPSPAFDLSNNASNRWNSTISRDHLEGAGIELNDASHASDYQLVLVIIGSFENDTENYVLSLQQSALPTSWQNTQAGDALFPGLLLVGLLFCLGFIILAEHKREIGLPKLEGSWKNEIGSIGYRLTAGYALEVGDMMLDDGWRSNSRIKKQRIKANEIIEGSIKVRGEGDFHMRLTVTVDDLGDWVLDLNLPSQELND